MWERMLTVALMLLLIAVAKGEWNKKVDGKYGEVKITGYQSCKMDVNGVIKNVTLDNDELVIPGYIIGLVKWECDNEFGTIIMDIECKECGIYCNYNQQFDKCKSRVVPIVVGITVSFIITGILLVIIFCLYNKSMINCVDKIVIWYLLRDDRKRFRMVKKLNKTTGTNNPILFRRIVLADKDMMSKIIESRLNMRKRLTGDEPEYMEICHSGGSADQYMARLEMKVINNPHHQKGISIAKMAPAVAMAAALINPQPTYACDKTLVMLSNGRICDDTACVDMNTFSIPIMSGSMICFNTIQNERLTLKIKGAELLQRYYPVYKTCSYDLDVSNTYECKSPGGQCWNHGGCKPNSVHGSLKRNTSYPAGYGCLSDTIGCDSWCYHQTSCTWYSWEVKPDMKQCSTIYQKSSQIWNIIIEISYKGVIKVINMNTNNPSFNLEGAELSDINKLPIFITSVISEHFYDFSFITHKDGTFYNVMASPMNMPIKNIVGEFQLSLDGKTTSFDESSIDCKVSSCKAYCTSSVQAYDRLNDTVSNKIDNKFIKVNYNNKLSDLKRIIPVQLTAQLFVGSVEIRELYVKPTNCDIEIIKSYGCTGCNIKPYIIVQSINIKTEGLLQVESNCTLTKPYMSCSEELYQVTFEDSPTYCVISIPAINKTMYLNFTYEFLGDLTNIRSRTSEGINQLLGSMVNSNEFWKSVIGTVNGMAILSFSSILIIRLVRIFSIYKVKENLDIEGSSTK